MTPSLRRAALPARGRGFTRACLVAVLLLLVLPAATLAWDAKAFSSRDESLLVSLVNQRRAAAGLSKMVVDGTLTSEARSRSRRLGDRHVLSHSIDGRSAFDELRARGYCFLDGAENLAWNTYPDDQATRVAWQNLQSSSGHLANMLGRSYTRIGVGAYKAADGTHVYVLLFVRACGTSAAKPPATAAPVRRTATPTRAPAPKAPAVAVTNQLVVDPGPTAPPDAERPRPATGDAAESVTFDVQDILELILAFLRVLARVGA